MPASKNLFDTPEKKKHGIEMFTDLINREGWQFLKKEVIGGDLEMITKQILDGLDNQGNPLTTEQTDLLRSVRQVYEKLLDYPEKMVTFLSGGAEGEAPEVDIYDTEEQIKKMREAKNAEIEAKLGRA